MNLILLANVLSFSTLGRDQGLPLAWQWVEREESLAPEPARLVQEPSSATYWLCDTGQLLHRSDPLV